MLLEPQETSSSLQKSESLMSDSSIAKRPPDVVIVSLKEREESNDALWMCLQQTYLQL